MQIEGVVLVGIGEFIWRLSSRTMSWHKWSWQQHLGWDQEHQRGRGQGGGKWVLLGNHLKTGIIN